MARSDEREPRPRTSGRRTLRRARERAQGHPGDPLKVKPRRLSFFTIEWMDRGLEPREPSNPLYPDGSDVDLAGTRRPICATDLPYPSKRCGYYIIECRRCGQVSVVGTAGRANDPRSVVIACKPKVT